MQQVLEILDSTLRRIEHELKTVAAMSNVNAALTMADPTLVLPSPAVGLIEMSAPNSFSPKADMVLRSLEPIGPDGEVLFGFADPSFATHPWNVREAEWLIESPTMDGRGNDAVPFARGIRVKIVQTKGARCTAGHLTLLVLGGPTLRWALERSSVRCHETKLQCAQPSLFSPMRVSTLPQPGGVHDHLDALLQDLLKMYIPPQLVGEPELEIDILFDEGIPVPPGSRPTVLANVAAIWNSINFRYPGPTEVQQSVSESPNRVVHPLQPRGLRPSWKAWDVFYVGGANDPKIRFEPRWFYKQRPLNGTNQGTFHICYLTLRNHARAFRPPSLSPHGSLQGDGSQAVLSVVLSPEARALLDREKKHLAVEFRVTTGQSANGIPNGTEFQVIDTTGFPPAERVTGRLIGDTWGGCDGAAAIINDCGSAGSVRCFFPSGYVRTVGDVLHVIEQYYGRDLEIADERDLLRAPEASGIRPLLVRVRFKRAGRPQREKSVVLASCRQFVNRYLAGNHTGEVHLVDADEEVGNL